MYVLHTMQLAVFQNISKCLPLKKVLSSVSLSFFEESHIFISTFSDNILWLSPINWLTLKSCTQITFYLSLKTFFWKNYYWQKCQWLRKNSVFLLKKVFLKISQNSQENTCARISFLIKLQASTLLKKRLWHSCFPVNIAKFLRPPFFTEHLRTVFLN